MRHALLALLLVAGCNSTPDKKKETPVKTEPAARQDEKSDLKRNQQAPPAIRTRGVPGFPKEIAKPIPLGFL